MDSSNGHHPERLPGFPPAEAPERDNEPRPEEIVAFERATDPYANMLPGISSIRAAQTIGRGVEVGKRGNRLIMAVSVLMLLALLLPLVFAIISQLGHH